MDEALEVAREAVDLTRQSDDPIDQANALMDFAVVLRHAGRDDEAAAATMDAVSLYERKGNLAALAVARRLAAELPTSAGPLRAAPVK